MLELAKQLGNISQARKMMGYSRDSFYRFKELDASKNYSRIGAGLIQSVVFEGERGHGGSDGGVFRH